MGYYSCRLQAQGDPQARLGLGAPTCGSNARESAAACPWLDSSQLVTSRPSSDLGPAQESDPRLRGLSLGRVDISFRDALRGSRAVGSETVPGSGILCYLLPFSDIEVPEKGRT